MIRHIIVCVIFLSAFCLAESAKAQSVGASGLPLPRFVSLKPSKAYMRTGPGRQYPIDWVFKRSNYPLEIVDEHGPWRKVKDHQGTEGWMLGTLLSSRRTGLVLNGIQTFYQDANNTSRIAMTAEKGVIALLLECENTWCLAEIDGTKGWIERQNLWGVYTHETID